MIKKVIYSLVCVLTFSVLTGCSSGSDTSQNNPIVSNADQTENVQEQNELNNSGSFKTSDADKKELEVVDFGFTAFEKEDVPVGGKTGFSIGAQIQNHSSSHKVKRPIVHIVGKNPDGEVYLDESVELGTIYPNQTYYFGYEVPTSFVKLVKDNIEVTIEAPEYCWIECEPMDTNFYSVTNLNEIRYRETIEPHEFHPEYSLSSSNEADYIIYSVESLIDRDEDGNATYDSDCFVIFKDESGNIIGGAFEYSIQPDVGAGSMKDALAVQFLPSFDSYEIYVYPMLKN